MHQLQVNGFLGVDESVPLLVFKPRLNMEEKVVEAR